MTAINIICLILFILLVGTVVGIRIYKIKQDNKKFNINDFITSYGDKIVEILKDSIKILTLSEIIYSSKEEYEKTLIKMTIEEIKNNYKEFGIDSKILSYIDSEETTNIIYNILHANISNILSELGLNLLELKKLYNTDKEE